MRELTTLTVPALAHYCGRALQDATGFDETRHVRDVAEALRQQARRAKAGLDVQNEAARWKLRAERQLGRMLGEREKNPGGKAMQAPYRLHDETGMPATLAEIGVTGVQAHRLQTVAGVDDATFEAQLAEIEAAGQEITSARIYNEARKRGRKADIAAQRAAIGAGTATMPAGAFEVVVVDPPWPYGWEGHYDPQGLPGDEPLPGDGPRGPGGPPGARRRPGDPGGRRLRAVVLDDAPLPAARLPAAGRLGLRLQGDPDLG